MRKPRAPLDMNQNKQKCHLRKGEGWVAEQWHIDGSSLANAAHFCSADTTRDGAPCGRGGLLFFSKEQKSGPQVPACSLFSFSGYSRLVLI